jgi:hypothetical protein
MKDEKKTKQNKSLLVMKTTKQQKERQRSNHSLTSFSKEIDKEELPKSKTKKRNRKVRNLLRGRSRSKNKQRNKVRTKPKIKRSEK